MLSYQFKPNTTSTAIYDFRLSARDISGNSRTGTLNSTYTYHDNPVRFKSPYWFSSSTGALTGTVGHMTMPTSVVSQANGAVEVVYQTGSDVASSQSVVEMIGSGPSTRACEMLIYNSRSYLLVNNNVQSIFNTGLVLTANTRYYCAVTWDSTAGTTSLWIGKINDDNSLSVTQVGSNLTISPDFSALNIVRTIQSNNSLSNFTGKISWIRFSSGTKTSFPTEDVNVYQITGA